MQGVQASVARSLIRNLFIAESLQPGNAVNVYAS